MDINSDNSCLITKGDANENIDNECVKEKNLVGVISNSIPNVGDILILFNHVSVTFKIVYYSSNFWNIIFRFYSCKNFYTI